MPSKADRSRVGIAAKAKASAEMINELSREELVELVTWNWYLVAQFSEQDIKDAKARIMRKKAEAAFAKWDELSRLAKDMPKNTLKQRIAWAEKYREAERFYKKYDRFWARANQLEFSHQREKEVNHA